MSELPGAEARREVIGGVTIGLGIALATYSYPIPLFPGAPRDIDALRIFSGLCLALLGNLTLPRREALLTRKIRPSDLFLYVRLQISRVRPAALGGFSLGFCIGFISMWILAFEEYHLRTLYQLILVASATVPPMWIYLRGDLFKVHAVTNERGRDTDASAEAAPDMGLRTDTKPIQDIGESSSAVDVERQESRSPNAEQNARLMILRTRFDEARERLRHEVRALDRRGRLNLVIGGFTTIVAATLLVYVVVVSEITETVLEGVLLYYIPRLSLVVFVEVFAFFFLRLYRASLQDIKFFQNELTNIDLKVIAIESALAGDNADALGRIAEKLAATERNFVLKKGESTVELERISMEKEGMKEILSIAANIAQGKATTS